MLRKREHMSMTCLLYLNIKEHDAFKVRNVN